MLEAVCIVFPSILTSDTPAGVTSIILGLSNDPLL